MKLNSEYQKFADKRFASFSMSLIMPTPSDIEGPFYKPNAPDLPDGILCGQLCVDLRLTGRIIGTDGELIGGAVLDIWQADAQGIYDNAGFTLRGKIRTGSDGQYNLQTIMPGDYQIAEDPPDFRCAHIHFKVSAEGFHSLTTQLYFPNDKYNETDHWFDGRRVIQHPVGVFDFVLERI